MYCRSCGQEIPDNSKFCHHCGESVAKSASSATTTKSNQDSGSASQWDPKLPIISLFTAIILLWSAFNYSSIPSFIVFGVPALLIIPRVRWYLVQWGREYFNLNLANLAVVAVGGVIYAILLLMAVVTVIGSTANDPTVGSSPTRQLAVGLLTIGIMFGIAVAIVATIRISRKLRPNSFSDHTESVATPEMEVDANNEMMESLESKSRETEDSRSDLSKLASDVSWLRGVQIFIGMAVLLFGIGITIQSPLGIPILLIGLALIPRVRSWSMEKLGGTAVE